MMVFFRYISICALKILVCLLYLERALYAAALFEDFGVFLVVDCASDVLLLY